jgi:ABC-type transport system substrate-binding protein
VTIPNDAERAAALADGRIDLDALMSPGGWSTAVANPDLVPTSTPDGRWHWLMVNCRDPRLSDVRVRRAISMAIDRQALLDEVFAGQGEPLLGGVVAPWSWASAPDLARFGPRGAPDEARALLHEVGLGDGASLEIAALDTLPIARREAELIADQLGRVGLSIAVRVLTAEEWGKTVRRDGAFQLATSYWGSPINDPDDFVYMAYRSGARYDTGSCGSGALDDVLEHARASIDQAERAAAYHRIQAIASDQVPLIPTIQPPVLRGYTARLRGFVPMRNAQLRTLSDAWLADAPNALTP